MTVPSAQTAATVESRSVLIAPTGKAGVARRSFRWRVPLRWYAISLLAPLLSLLIAVAIHYGLAPLLLSHRIGCCLAIMIVVNNVAEEIAWTPRML